MLSLCDLHDMRFPELSPPSPPRSPHLKKNHKEVLENLGIEPRKLPQAMERRNTHINVESLRKLEGSPTRALPTPQSDPERGMVLVTSKKKKRIRTEQLHPEKPKKTNLMGNLD